MFSYNKTNPGPAWAFELSQGRLERACTFSPQTPLIIEREQVIPEAGLIKDGGGVWSLMGFWSMKTRTGRVYMTRMSHVRAMGCRERKSTVENV